MRKIIVMEESYLLPSLDLAEAVFTAHASVGLPAAECLMVKELVPGWLADVSGQVSYRDYETLR